MLFGFSWSHTFSPEGAAYWHWGRVWSYVWSVFQVLFCIFALHSNSRIKNTTNKIDLCLQVRVFLYTLAWPSSLLLVSLIAISKPGNVHLWGRAFLKMTNFLLLFDVCYRWIRMLRWLRRNWRWDTNFWLQYICCKISWHFQQAQICNQKFRKTFGLWCHKFLLSHVSSSCLNQNWYNQTHISEMSKSQATITW